VILLTFRFFLNSRSLHKYYCAYTSYEFPPQIHW